MRFWLQAPPDALESPADADSSTWASLPPAPPAEAGKTDTLHLSPNGPQQHEASGAAGGDSGGWSSWPPPPPVPPASLPPPPPVHVAGNDSQHASPHHSKSGAQSGSASGHVSWPPAPAPPPPALGPQHLCQHRCQHRSPAASPGAPAPLPALADSPLAVEAQDLLERMRAEEAASAGMEGLFEDSSRLHASSRSAPDDDSDEGEDARLSANSAASLAANGEEDGRAKAEAAEAAEEPVPSAPRPPAIVPGSSLEAAGVSQPTASAVARAVFAVLSAQETDAKDDLSGGSTPPLSDSGPSPPPLRTAGGASPSGPWCASSSRSQQNTPAGLRSALSPLARGGSPDPMREFREGRRLLQAHLDEQRQRQVDLDATLARQEALHKQWSLARADEEEKLRQERALLHEERRRMLREQLAVQRQHAPSGVPPANGHTSDPHPADSADDDGLGRIGPASAAAAAPPLVRIPSLNLKALGGGGDGCTAATPATANAAATRGRDGRDEGGRAADGGRAVDADNVRRDSRASEESGTTPRKTWAHDPAESLQLPNLPSLPSSLGSPRPGPQGADDEARRRTAARMAAMDAVPRSARGEAADRAPRSTPRTPRTPLVTPRPESAAHPCGGGGATPRSTPRPAVTPRSVAEPRSLSGALATAQALRGHDAPILSLVMGPANFLFSGASDGTIRAWKLWPSGHDCVGTFRSHAGAVRALEHMAEETHATAPARPDGWLFSAGSDGCVRIWRWAASRTAAGGLPAAGASAGGQPVWKAAVEATLRTHKSESELHALMLGGESHHGGGGGDPPAPLAAHDAAGTWLAAGGESGRIYIWRLVGLPTGATDWSPAPLTIDAHSAAVLDLTLLPPPPPPLSPSSPPALPAATVTSKLAAARSKLSAAGAGARLVGGGSGGGSRASARLRWRLASSSKDRSVRLWLLEAGTTFGSPLSSSLNATPLCTLGPPQSSTAHRDVVRALAVVGADLYSTGRDKTLRLWQQQQQQQQPNGAPIEPTAAAPSANQSIRAARAPALAPPADGGWVCARSLAAHTDEVLALVAQRQGAWPRRAPLQLGGSAGLLFSGSRSGEVRIWDRESLVCLDTWVVHSSAIHSLLVTEDCLVSAGGDGTIKVHRAAPARAKGEAPPQTA